MKKRKFLQLGLGLLAAAVCVGSMHAQESVPTTTGSIIEIEVDVEGLDEMKSQKVEALRQKLAEIKGIENLELRMEKLNALEEVIDQIGNKQQEDKLLFMYKSAKTNESKPYLGVYLEEAESGVRLSQVKANTAAAQAGLQANDVVISLNNASVETIDELQTMIKKMSVGEKVKINFLRDGQTQETTAILGARESDYVVAHQRRHRHCDFYAAKQSDPCTELAKLEGEPFIGIYIDIDYTKDGANIRSVVSGTGAEKSNLQAGDRLRAINGETVVDYNSLRKVLAQYQPGEIVKLSYVRGENIGKTSVILSSMADRRVERRAMLEELCEEQAPEVSEAETLAEENTLEMDFTPYQASLTVFPNPVQDVVNVQLQDGNGAETTIRLLSSQGKLLMQQQINGDNEQFTQQLDVSDLPAGLYLVTVTQGDAVLSKKISVK